MNLLLYYKIIGIIFSNSLFIHTLLLINPKRIVNYRGKWKAELTKHLDLFFQLDQNENQR